MSPFPTGTVAHGGIPVPALPDARPAPHWSLEAIAATDRPRQPDVHGTRVAFILDRDTSDVWVLDPDLRQFTVDRPLMPPWEDVGPAWSPEGSTIAYVRGDAVWLTEGALPRRLCDGSSPVWVGPRELVVEVERADRTVLAVVDTGAGDSPATDPTGWPRPLPGLPGDLGQVAAHPQRRAVACVHSPRDDLNAARVAIVDLDAGTIEELPGPPGIHDRAPQWWPAGGAILFASEESGWYEIHRWDLAGAVRSQVTSDDADFDQLTCSEHGVAAIRTRHGVADLVLIDPDAEPDHRVTVLAPGGTWATPRWTATGDLVATHESPDTPPRMVKVSRDGVITDLVAPAPAPVLAAPHVGTEHLWYPAPGGDVPAFLIRPPGATPDTPCPAIVHPHGGPTSHYGAEWDGVAQYFVDKGYAWLAPNFKGSTSYGRDHERADHGVWGVADTADCLAAHAWLAAQDWVDPRRIGIFGASYGSYMALCSVVDGDAFACAVAKYGDCDILTSWAQGDRIGRLDLERMMGHPSANPDGYRAGSPIHRIDRISAPILIAHGEQDARVHPAQSQELVEALDRLGATYTYVTYPGEAHGFLHREAFLDFYRRLERFLDWYLL